MTLVREPDAGKPPVRFDKREVETEHGMRLLRHRRGNPETDYVEAYPTAPPLDSTRTLQFSCHKAATGGRAHRDIGYIEFPILVFVVHPSRRAAPPCSESKVFPADGH